MSHSVENVAPDRISLTNGHKDASHYAMQRLRLQAVSCVREVDLRECDPGMLYIVLRNLLSNALKYTPRGGRIHVLARPDGEEVRLDIQDSGVGMDRQTQDGIFSVSRKTSTPGTDGEPGSGLGLLLCREFTEAQNGRIHVESTPGQGTTFSLFLPRARDCQ